MKCFLPIAVFLSAVLASAEEPDPKEQDVQYSLKGTYGTLKYDGIVSRIDRGKEFEYSISELKLEFDPAGRTNPTQRIDLKAIRLVATVKPADGKGRSSILYSEDSAAAAVLTADSPTATFRDLRFTVSREIVTKADYLGFSAGDGKFIWPMKMQTIAAKLPQNPKIVGWGETVDPAGDCKFAVNQETLTITVPGSHHDLNPQTSFASNMSAPRLLSKAGDNFTVEVVIDALDHPKPDSSSSQGASRYSYVGAGLLGWIDDKNFVRFERAVNGDSDNVFIQIEAFVDGKVILARSESCADEPIHLRIDRKGRVFSFLRSTDGTVWKQVTLVQIPLQGEMQCGVMAVNATSGEFTPVFRSLKIHSAGDSAKPQANPVVEVELKQEFVPSGFAAQRGSIVALRAEMDQAPEIVGKQPDGLLAPKFGYLEVGSKRRAFILEEPLGKPASLHIDTNGDGDLTNDPPTKWEVTTQSGVTFFSGEGKVNLGDGRIGTIIARRFDPADERRAALWNTLLYYADYGYEVSFQMDGKSFSTFVSGEITGDTALEIDRDGNEKISGNYEVVSLWEPFNFTGTTYVFSIRNDGLALETAATSLPVWDLPPDLQVGKPALKFTAHSINNKSVSFPEDYAGKIVMLDFWATWCGPCIAEIPNMKAAWGQWHDKGFEILGINMDNEGELEKVRAFLEKEGLPWEQISEGKGWNSTIGQLHDVTAIPFVLLVDGDTGSILATSMNLRGPGLGAFVGEQLLGKSSSAERGSAEYWQSVVDYWTRAVDEDAELALSAYRRFVSAERWSDAIPFGEKALADETAPSSMWLGVITTIALASDLELHRDYCEKMVKRFESAEGSSVATHICKSCLLLPGCEDIANRFEKPVAEELESGNTSRAFVAFRWGLRALLACRNGDAKLALEYLQKAEGIPATEMARAQNLAIRALAQGKLGMRSESSASRALAEKIIEGLKSDPVLNSHQDLLIARILLRESAE